MSEKVPLEIIPGAGGIQCAPKLIGMSKVKEWIFTGRNLTVRDTRDLGESKAHTSPARERHIPVGLADYVAASASTAFELAKDMSLTGEPCSP